MTIVMDMSGYEIKQEAGEVEEYDDEVLCAGWNPQLALVADRPVTTLDKHTEFPGGPAKADVEDFLQKMYRYQC